MELVLVRHAQPAWNQDNIAQVDPRLTDLGWKQAERAARRLAIESFDEVLVSTATRAIQTAEPLLERLDDVAHERRGWLHEIRMPNAWQGTPAEHVGRVLARSRERSRAEWWDGFPGGESFHDFHARVTTGLTNELAEAGIVRDDEGLWEVPDDGPRLLMIAHAGTNSVILGHLLGLDPEPWEWERFASGHASVTVLRSIPMAGRRIFSLQSFSDTSHLPAEMVTA